MLVLTHVGTSARRHIGMPARFVNRAHLTADTIFGNKPTHNQET